MGDVTVILNAIEGGNGKLAEELIPIVYEELRFLAARNLAHEPPEGTLETWGRPASSCVG